MTGPDVAWAAVIGSGVALETWALASGRDRWTLSRATRRALRCHTPAGRATTTVLLGAGSAWLTNHLLAVTPSEVTP